MAFTLPKTIQPGTNENAADVQANDAALRDEFNAVTQTATLVGAQLQSKTVTAANIADNTIGTSQIAGGGVFADNIRSSDNDKLGLSSTGVVRRGAVNIAATESRTNTAYGTLTTPDRVQNVVLPANGLIAVAYQATWQESVQGAAKAAIFIGSNQLQIAPTTHAGGGSWGPTAQEASTGSTAGGVAAIPLATATFGLASTGVSTGGSDYSGDATTGQIVAAGWGGPCYVFAAAGTYDVSVQFKASSGSVTAKNRKLWVWTIGF